MNIILSGNNLLLLFHFATFLFAYFSFCSFFEIISKFSQMWIHQNITVFVSHSAKSMANICHWIRHSIFSARSIPQFTTVNGLNVTVTRKTISENYIRSLDRALGNEEIKTKIITKVVRWKHHVEMKLCEHT